ncbi:hypothetical protein [Planobispora longispora]|nr:hypothetical protein [Planobispora longispora]
MDVPHGSSFNGESFRLWNCNKGWRRRFHIVGAGGGHQLFSIEAA